MRCIMRVVRSFRGNTIFAVAAMANLLFPLCATHFAASLKLSVELVGGLTTFHEVLCALGTFFILRSAFRQTVKNKFNYFFLSVFFFVSIGDLTYGLVTYILRIPSPREYIPLVHEIPYVLFAWTLAASSIYRAIGGLKQKERSYAVVLITCLSALFFVFSFKMVLHPF